MRHYENDRLQLMILVSSIFFYSISLFSIYLIIAYQNGTLFQVKAVYTYLPLHDDEISMKPNDIINVTRMVC